jgi:hypothetical protein
MSWWLRRGIRDRGQDLSPGALVRPPPRLYHAEESTGVIGPLPSLRPCVVATVPYVDSSLSADADIGRTSPTAQVLSLALRAADRESRTHAAIRPQGVRQGASSSGTDAGA